MQPVGYAPAPPMAAAGGGYEFNQYENGTIEGVGKYSRMSGVLSIVGGAVMLLAAIPMALAGIWHAFLPESAASQVAVLGVASCAIGTTALVYLSVGWFYIKAGGALRAVVQTQGNDVALLMTAVGSLKRAFQIEAIAQIVACVLGVFLGLGIVLLAPGR